MLDSETKRRIDTCRDILVGKVPDPKSQVEQITVALIYKFMDDMDLQSEELGGQRKFFTKEFERYRWAKLVAPGVGGQEMLNTYSEALAKMVENDGLPQLFRNIFRNAYLPYRDPETLRAFLREINSFNYDHSERLGDAFEYLLSVLGSQGDAGQFRTPRHIIDFIVEIINPQKHEVIMDPACGTAGFLISAYKHVLKQNSTHVVNGNGHGEEGDAVEQTLESPLRYPGDLLKPEDRTRLARNIRGYDISPDMVRLSLVNLYLHGFADPKIEEYDTLTSDDKWTEMADVILANPPFMSPKGGIKPHTRFQVQSKRSEVLFVDYIAEHLTPNGRAAIIVPEGIIFQSQSAYVALRKMLVENHLAAVISLPAGVFNPYSGVKTSILILDRAVAKASKHVAFFKVDNDGFQLGAQRKAQKGSQLLQVKTELTTWMEEARNGRRKELGGHLGEAVERKKIAITGDYNLSGDKYADKKIISSDFPLLPFDQVCTLEYGKSLPQASRADGPYPVMGSNGPSGYHNEYLIKGPGIVVGRKGSAGEVTWVEEDFYPIDTTYFVKILNQETTDIRFIYHLLRSLKLTELRGGAGIPGLNRTDVYERHRIPLPPLEIQREIVAEIEGYQRVIDGARAVVENYRPIIETDSQWGQITIDEICEVVRGSSPRPQGDPAFFGGPVPRLMVADITRDGMYVKPQIDSLTELGATKSRPMKKGDVVMAVSGNPGLPAILAQDCCIHDGFVGFRNLSAQIDNSFFYFWLAAQHEKNGLQSVGSIFRNLTTSQVKEFKVPFPPLEVQRKIASEIEAEQAIVNANRDLIARFEKKIEAAIARVWGDSKSEEGP
jgi:type I restriction enzyme M protein